MEKAGVTELYVRMHCNSCAHKIRKAIRAIDGVHDINIDINQQKITVVGGADPELLVKAIKKKKKTATVSSHTKPPSESPPAEATPPPPAEPPKDVPPTEPPKDPPPPPAAETPEVANPPHQEPNVDVGEVQNVMHPYHPQNYVYGGHWNSFGHETRGLAPYHVMHSYNTHRPSPYVTEYASDYGLASATPRDHTSYDGYDGYGDGYYQNRGGGTNQMASVFSEENPNSCTIA